MDETPARDAEQWKALLNEQKESLKKKEKEWRDSDGALRRGISRLTFAIGGVDTKLDKLLSQLRDAIRENHTTASIVDVINDIADLVKHLDDQGRAESSAGAMTNSLAARLLHQIEFPDPLRKQARKLVQRLGKDDPDAVDADVIELLRAALTGANGAAPASTGFIDRLMSAFGKPTESGATDGLDVVAGGDAQSLPLSHAKELLRSLIQRIRVPEADIYTVKKLIARLNSARDTHEFDGIVAEYSEVANAVQRQGGAPDSSGSRATASTTPRIEEVFIQFVEELAVPSELTTEANRIKDELAREGDATDFTQAFKAIVNLVTSMRRTLVQEKLELQEFLQQLTVRLQELDHHLGGTQSQQKSWAEEGRNLEAVVQNQVKDIKSTVDVASDLDQLKTVISNRLDILQEHLNEYQNNEVRRQERLSTELELVKSRLVNVETEADQLRTRLKDKHQQSIIDPLTGAHNRLAYDERVIAEVARWRRYKNPLAIAVLDVDHFKKINDHYGHKAGDKALKLIAQVLKENLRETDFLARYGGEEFVVLITETPEDGVAGVTEKLRKAVEECKFHYASKDVPITISGGYAMFRDGDNAEIAFNRADGALYAAKERGRNQVCAA